MHSPIAATIIAAPTASSNLLSPPTLNIVHPPPSSPHEPSMDNLTEQGREGNMGNIFLIPVRDRDAALLHPQNPSILVEPPLSGFLEENITLISPEQALRQLLISIQQDSLLSAKEKSHKMQQAMMLQYKQGKTMVGSNTANLSPSIYHSPFLSLSQENLRRAFQATNPAESNDICISNAESSSLLQPFAEVPDRILKTLTPRILEPSYQNKSDLQDEQSSGVLGCRHYQRNCKLFAECCRDWILCRYCHDEGAEVECVQKNLLPEEKTELKDDGNTDQSDAHVTIIPQNVSLTRATNWRGVQIVNDTLLPKQTQEFLPSHTLESSNIHYVLCMLCQHPQPLSSTCRQCHTSFGTYSCLSCRLFENDPKRIPNLFHCADCSICRIGPPSDYQHCHTCDCCILSSIPHKCIEKKLFADCPICGEFMHSSPRAILFMPCGHAIHWLCYTSHIKNSYQCPLCLKSILDMTTHFKRLEALLKEQPMPQEYAHLKNNVLCNDCEKKSTVPFHFLYHQCAHCQSFNTKVI